MHIYECRIATEIKMYGKLICISYIRWIYFIVLNTPGRQFSQKTSWCLLLIVLLNLDEILNKMKCFLRLFWKIKFEVKTVLIILIFVPIHFLVLIYLCVWFITYNFKSVKLNCNKLPISKVEVEIYWNFCTCKWDFNQLTLDS